MSVGTAATRNGQYVAGQPFGQHAFHTDEHPLEEPLEAHLKVRLRPEQWAHVLRQKLPVPAELLELPKEPHAVHEDTRHQHLQLQVHVEPPLRLPPVQASRHLRSELDHAEPDTVLEEVAPLRRLHPPPRRLHQLLD